MWQRPPSDKSGFKQRLNRRKIQAVLAVIERITTVYLTKDHDAIHGKIRRFNGMSNIFTPNNFEWRFNGMSDIFTPNNFETHSNNGTTENIGRMRPRPVPVGIRRNYIRTNIYVPRTIKRDSRYKRIVALKYDPQTI